MEGEFKAEWTRIYAWLNPFAIHLKLANHCSLAVHQYEMKSKQKLQNKKYIIISTTTQATLLSMVLPPPLPDLMMH